ncbi:MAG: HWE histidine kinase domain-containing protein [Rhodospirillales bacterium]
MTDSPEHPERISDGSRWDVEDGVDAGEIGIWRWDLATNRLWWSRNLTTIHRADPAAVTGRLDDFKRDIHPGDRAAVLAAVRRALAERIPYRVEYRLPPREGEDEVWLEARGRVIADGDGSVTGMTGVCLDITARKAAERAAEDLSHRQAVLAELGQYALQTNDLESVFDLTVRKCAETLNVELCKVLEVLPGGRELILRAGIGWDDGLVGAARVPYETGSQGGYTLRAGTPVVVDDLATETRFHGPGLLFDHGVVSGVSVLIAGTDGRAFGVLGAHTRHRRRFTQSDCDFMQSVANILASAIARRLHVQRFELALREMRHRNRNLLSIILALFNSSAQGSDDLDQFKAKYQNRLLALGRAHSLISEAGWTTTSMRSLLTETLQPIIDRLTLDGPEVELNADTAFSLSMVLHELATNAAKYGALSAAEGRVDIAWNATDVDGQTDYALAWTERGGPPPATGGSGFGSQLIRMVIEHQLQGKAQMDFGRDGLSARFAFR